MPTNTELDALAADLRGKPDGASAIRNEALAALYEELLALRTERVRLHKALVTIATAQPTEDLRGMARVAIAYDDRAARILPGVWQCTACQTRYRIRHTPGVLVREPVNLPDHICASCGACLEPADAKARETEARVARNAAEYTSLTGNDPTYAGWVESDASEEAG